MRTWRPDSEPGLVEAIRGSEILWHSTDPLWDVVDDQPGDRLELDLWTGVSFYSPEDLVVTFRSGTRLDEVQASLREQGQTLPLGSYPIGDANPTLAQAIGFALPHVGEAVSGSWRDWILGMRVALGDGTVATSGSKVVKSVAGYDAHKLFVGARGSYGVVVEVTMRVKPIAGELPDVAARFDSHPGRAWIQRVSASDFPVAARSSELVAADPESCTLWAFSDHPLPRFPDDWVVRGGPGPDALEWQPDEIAFLQRAKRLLNPAGKLNPGALGLC